jgi:hypothetical protein
MKDKYKFKKSVGKCMINSNGVDLYRSEEFENNYKLVRYYKNKKNLMKNSSISIMI